MDEASLSLIPSPPESLSHKGLAHCQRESQAMGPGYIKDREPAVAVEQGRRGESSPQDQRASVINDSTTAAPFKSQDHLFRVKDNLVI